MTPEAQFPDSIADDQNLGFVANGVSGVLNNSLTTGSTSVNIKNGTCFRNGIATACNVAFQPDMFITIDDEIMQIGSITAATGVTVLNLSSPGFTPPSINGRALDGSQLAIHTANNVRRVYNNLVAWNHNAQNKEIEAIESNIIGYGRTLKSFGAKGDGTTDDTAAIQAAFDASTGGKPLICPPGVYKITAALYVPSFISLIGPAADLLNPGGGCCFKWYGSAPATAYLTGSGMVNVHSANGVNIRGISFDGSVTARLSGLVLNANGASGGIVQRTAIRECAFTGFGDPVNDIAGAGICIGTGTGTYYGTEQVDGIAASDLSFSHVQTCIKIFNPNYAYSKLERIVGIYINKGIDYIFAGFSILTQCAFGLMQGTDPVVVQIASPHGQMLIEDIQAEQDSSVGQNAKMFNIIQQSGFAGDESPITLLSNTFGFISEISCPVQNIVSIGNYGNASQPFTVTIAAYACNIESFRDHNITWVIPNNGTNLSTVGLPQDRLSFREFFANFQSSNTIPIARFGVRSTSTTDTEPFISLETLTTQKWKLFWSATKIGFRDTLASNYIGLSLDNGLSGSDALLIHHNSTVVAGQTFPVSGAANRKPGRYWFPSQTGTNGAIIVVTTDGTWQPVLGDMITVLLSTNTLLAASANTITINGIAYGILSHYSGANIATAYFVGGIFSAILGNSNIFKDIGQ